MNAGGGGDATEGGDNGGRGDPGGGGDSGEDAGEDAIEMPVEVEMLVEVADVELLEWMLVEVVMMVEDEMLVKMLAGMLV